MISHMVCAWPDLSKVEKTIWEVTVEQQRTGVMKTEVEIEIQIIKRQSILICSYLKEWQKKTMYYPNGWKCKYESLKATVI